MKKIKLVRFKAACAGEVQHLKFSDNYVSNSHWIAARSLFADVLPACGEEQLRPGPAPAAKADEEFI